ncbi:E3 ubiquitin-protein ligase TRIM69-like [Heterodontus francisci]|uniref:E3 ubiquitin-protein ligase TRIM69-like n=1 Tax=Heterodontus francisci TaxID=7792 RepID=UPI00355BA563
MSTTPFDCKVDLPFVEWHEKVAGSSERAPSSELRVRVGKHPVPSGRLTRRYDYGPPLSHLRTRFIPFQNQIGFVTKDYKYAGCNEPASNPTSRTDASEETPRKRSFKNSTEENKRKSPAYLTLNPNTAHPRLLLSDDLTIVTYGDVKQDVPDNSERFDTCVCVLGSEAFASGKHYWEVQVGTKTEWDVGVVKESISRKGHTTATPDSGYWIVWLRNGNEYKATTVPRTRLNVPVKPRAIGVYLDYEAGQVSFYNVDNMSHLYTFIDTFTERLFPYFSPGINDDGENSEPLKVLPPEQPICSIVDWFTITAELRHSVTLLSSAVLLYQAPYSNSLIECLHVSGASYLWAIRLE